MVVHLQPIPVEHLLCVPGMWQQYFSNVIVDRKVKARVHFITYFHHHLFRVRRMQSVYLINELVFHLVSKIKI